MGVKKLVQRYVKLFYAHILSWKEYYKRVNVKKYFLEVIYRPYASNELHYNDPFGARPALILLCGLSYALRASRSNISCGFIVRRRPTL